MEYFTDEALVYDPFASKEEQDKQELKLKQAIQLYKARFKKIEGRISKKVYQYYSKQNFHDYNMVGIEVKEQENKKNPLKVTITIINGKGGDILKLTYTSISHFHIYYNNEIAYRGFGCIVEEEILDVDENFLSHEIALSSGSSIKIIFKNKSMTISKQKKTD